MNLGGALASTYGESLRDEREMRKENDDQALHGLYTAHLKDQYQAAHDYQEAVRQATLHHAQGALTAPQITKPSMGSPAAPTVTSGAGVSSGIASPAPPPEMGYANGGKVVGRPGKFNGIFDDRKWNGTHQGLPSMHQAVFHHVTGADASHPNFMGQLSAHVIAKTKAAAANKALKPAPVKPMPIAPAPGLTAPQPPQVGYVDGGAVRADPRDATFQRNAPYVKPGVVDYTTPLAPADEMKFRDWVQSNKVPFDPDDKKSDYDMRGYYKALNSGDPNARQSPNANDGTMHFPDTYKTPYHQSFSNESQYAGPGAPAWNNKDQLVDPQGRVMFDERAPAPQPSGTTGAPLPTYNNGGGVIMPPWPGYNNGGALGAVAGPGTGTSDSINARLSNGEFVIPADVVRAKGEEFFQKLLEKHHTEVPNGRP